jgi:hypothetical protein
VYCRGDGVEAAALAVLDCIFAAAEIAPAPGVPEARGAAGQRKSVPAQAATKAADGLLREEATAETLTTPGGIGAGSPAASQEPAVQARLLVSQYAAGLLIGTAAGDSTAASITAADMPECLGGGLHWPRACCNTCTTGKLWPKLAVACCRHTEDPVETVGAQRYRRCYSTTRA